MNWKKISSSHASDLKKSTAINVHVHACTVKRQLKDIDLKRCGSDKKPIERKGNK